MQAINLNATTMQNINFTCYNTPIVIKFSYKYYIFGLAAYDTLDETGKLLIL